MSQKDKRALALIFTIAIATFAVILAGQAAQIIPTQP